MNRPRITQVIAVGENPGWKDAYIAVREDGTLFRMELNHEAGKPSALLIPIQLEYEQGS